MTQIESDLGRISDLVEEILKLGNEQIESTGIFDNVLLRSKLNHLLIKYCSRVICSYCEHISVTKEDMRDHILSCDKRPEKQMFHAITESLKCYNDIVERIVKFQNEQFMLDIFETQDENERNKKS